MTTFVDATLIAADSALRTLFAPHRTSRPTPKASAPAEQALSDEEKKQAGALMRVNHVGEICAQALYTSQALAARLGSAGLPRSGGRRAMPPNEALAQHLEHAGQEETDHLAWCKQRLDQLGDRPSLLNPLWYAGAFGIGLLAGKLGPGVSLGFVVETEHQVEAHLASHLDRLPAHDVASRAIVQQMKADEARHAKEAQASGATPLPAPVQSLMRSVAKVMTTIAHRV